MSANAPKRHHYVPQFYLRRFALVDDPHKVRVLEQHGELVVSDRKSIDRIGYEERFHDYDDRGTTASIEAELNRTIETPFAGSSTWSKISSGAWESLDPRDRLPLYGFARHLQLRNLETLRFIEAQNARFRAGDHDSDMTDEERAMHAWIASSLDNAHALFREGALDTTLPEDAQAINVMVCRSPITLRTSTSPAVRILHPGPESALGPFFNPLRTWWLALDRECGVFIVTGGPPGFSNSTMPADAARMVNRQYLVQLLKSRWVRYMIADDEFLGEDLAWAGYTLASQTTHGRRWRRTNKT